MPDITVIVCLTFDHRAPVDGLAKFKACLRSCPLVDAAMDVTGAFDMVLEGRCPSLDAFQQGMERLRPQLAAFVTRIETNLVSNRCRRHLEDEDSALWLPCEGGRRRVFANQIDKVVAEGDYMRVHVGGSSCLIHQTMARLSRQLPPNSFVRLHRSSLVRIAFIDRVVHRGRKWAVLLKDGSCVSVAQSHVQDLVRVTSGESSIEEPASPKMPELIASAHHS